jgi:hypothetical protein
MIFVLYVWWVLSVYAISTREKRKAFAMGISFGVEHTLSRIYSGEKALNSIEHVSILRDILKSAKLPKDTSGDTL